ncbi:MAG: type II secretion system protein GspK [bacterium]|nr:type II secretion system protein GspK [bacterium]
MKNTRGIALIVVLWIMVILEVVIGGVVYVARLQARISNYRYRECQTRAISRSGIERMIGSIYEEKERHLKDETFPETYLRSFKGEIGGGEYEVRLTNEEGKVNLNSASKNLLEKVFASFGFANSDAVLRFVFQFRQAGRKLETMRELLLSGDITEEIVAKVETIASIRSNGKINVNTAPLELLKALPGMTEKQAQSIIEYRLGQDRMYGTSDDQYINEQTITQIIDGSVLNQIKDLLCYQAENFQAVCTASYGQTYNKVTAYLFFDPDSKGIEIKYWQED